jgi:MFS transporter, ACS family, hexuronate transporter
MPETGPKLMNAPRPIPHLRWWIGGLLFISTVINYMDRQTLSVLGPYLKEDYRWNNEDFALIVISFRVAYAIGQTLSGRFIDRIGTRRGLSLSVTWYSIAAMLTSLASGLRSFCGFRFLLGLGESANWPGATKAVAEWFPKRERGWAVALFDSGSSIGGAIAPFLVLWLYHNFGGWRPAFIIIGTLGFLWLAAWRWLYPPPEQHPRIGAAEREMLAAEKASESAARVGVDGASQAADNPPPARPRWNDLIRMPKTWGVISARSLTDPVWFFVADWLAIYLVAKGVKLESGLIAFWIPFLAADLGNFTGGGVSSWLIRRGWPVLRSRKTVFVVGCAGVLCLIPTIYTSNIYALAALIGMATFTYAAASTMALVLPSDLYSSESVASVSGMSGTGAGIGTIISTYLVGYVSDRYSFAPIMVVASCIPLIGAVLVLLLIRSPRLEKSL